MKKVAFVLLASSFLLSVFDGLATYHQVAKNSDDELNFWPSYAQRACGIDVWLALHFLIFTLAALGLVLVLLKKILWPLPIYFICLWFVLEVGRLGLHLWGIKIGGLP